MKVKVLFIIDTRVITQEPLGLMHIASFLKQNGHECAALDLARERELITSVRKHNPQVLAFTASTGHHRRLVEISQAIKKEIDILSIFGGPHPTFWPEMIEKEGVDFICRGEGEYPMLELVEALSADKDFTKIPNLWIKRKGKIHRNSLRPYIYDLDSLPWPDRPLFNSFRQLSTFSQPRVEHTRFFMSGRGCPYNCTYCFNHIARKLTLGRYVRWRSVENVINEIKEVKAKYMVNFVFFQDDTFVLRADWLKSFCREYQQEIRIPFGCNVRANLVTDSVSQMLAEAGCIHVFMGLESGNDHIRNVVLNRNISREQLIQACRSLHNYAISITMNNMSGLPFETIDTFLDTIELNMICKPEQMHMCFYVPYPRTKLARIAVEEGLFHEENVDTLPEQFIFGESSVILKLENAKQIGELTKLIHLCKRFPIFYPIIRSLFKRRHGNWVKALVSSFIFFVQKIHLRITGGSFRLPKKQT